MKTAFISLLGLLLIAIVGYMLYSQRVQPVPLTDQNNKITLGPSDMKQPTVSDEVVDALRRGGSSFNDPSGLYNFLYPSDYKIDSQGQNMTRIYKTGATQAGQTEMYDGVIMVFESIDLNGQTLEQWVDAQIQTSRAGGIAEITRPKTATSVNTYPGFTYQSRGLGESTYVYVQKDTNSQSAVGITYAVMDPEQNNYKSEVDAVISTLQILK